MKKVPYTFAVETAVNALQFCIVARARVDAEGAPVMCVPMNIYAHHRISAMLELKRTGLYNDVIDDAVMTAIAFNAVACKYPCFPRIGAGNFAYTAAQYTEALQNLFAGLESTEEE